MMIIESSINTNVKKPKWNYVLLSEHCYKPQYGYTASASNKSDGPKFLRITDLQNDTVDWEAVPYCDCPNKIKNEYILERGDIVVARIGATTGKTFCLSDCPEAIFASYLIRIKTKSTLMPEFLWFYCQSQSYWKYIDQSKGGRLKGGINVPILLNLLLPLPPLHEQRAIVYVLKAIFKAKVVRQREIELKRERRAALMEYLFTHGTREEQCKKTEIGTIPQSWQIFRLKEVIHVKSGKRLPKGENFAKDLTQYPYIRIVDFMNETVKINALKYLNEETYKKIYRYIITKNDIYISIAGTIGLVGTIPDELDGANLTENAARLVIKDEQFIQKDFVAKFLNSETAQKQIENLTVKTSQPKLALTRIEQIKIPVACYIEQSNIVKILKACDDKITALEHEAELLDELFQAMLEQLMTGQLSVVPLIEENKEASP